MDRINGADTINIGGGRRGFRSENLASGVAGTEVTALFLNALQEEIMKVIVGAGLAPDEADWSQLWQALKVLGLSLGNRNSRWTAVKAMNLTATPAAPADGDIYLVPAGATGAWAGHAGAIAEWVETAWTYYIAPNGHGIGLPDGRVFMKMAGDYVEWLEAQPLTVSKLSRMPWLPVISMTLSSAPGAPTKGDCYLVPTGASGIWAAKVGKIAEWNGSAWSYAQPSDGHGISLPDGRIFERISGTYAELKASETRAGLVSLATIAEAFAGLLSDKAVTPQGLSYTLANAQLGIRNTVFFQAPGTSAWVVPANVTSVYVTVIGGGGSGGPANTSYRHGGGGGGGGKAEGWVAVIPGSSIAITVGAGGVATSVGVAGGSSSFGAAMSATGGGGGLIGQGGDSGVGTGGSLNSGLGDGGSGISTTDAYASGKGGGPGGRVSQAGRGPGGGGGGSYDSGSTGSTAAGNGAAGLVAIMY